MKKLIASMFGLSLLALLLLSGDSRTTDDEAGLQLLAHCGVCEHGDSDDDSGDTDGSDNKSRLLVEDEDEDEDSDGSDNKSRLLAEDEDDDEDSDGSDKKSRLLAEDDDDDDDDDHDDGSGRKSRLMV